MPAEGVCISNNRMIYKKFNKKLFKATVDISNMKLHTLQLLLISIHTLTSIVQCRLMFINVWRKFIYLLFYYKY